MSGFKSIVLLSLLASAPAWAVNKCVGSGGAVLYQEAPCPSGSKDVSSAMSAEQTAPSVSRPEDAARFLNAQMETPAARQQVQASIERRLAAEREAAAAAARPGAAVAIMSDEEKQRHRRARICNGSYNQEPTVGMAELVVLNCLLTGVPAMVQETETASGITRTYAYGYPRLHLIVRNGVVVLVQR